MVINITIAITIIIHERQIDNKLNSKRARARVCVCGNDDYDNVNNHNDR